MKKLWILKPVKNLPKNNPWEPWFDKAFGFIIRAETEELARTYAASRSGDEGDEAWMDSTYSTCEELSADGPEGVVMRDFSAA